MIRFLHGNTVIELSDEDPRMTVLHWLREVRQMTGTKQGCGAGDCGACTVVIGRVRAGKMYYHTASSCLLMLHQLEGGQLLTIENLACGKSLHPVQQLLVKHHASQCGFCSPGMAMSLFGLQKSATGDSLRNIERHLAGNLCRCTGYRPLVLAAAAATRLRKPDQFSREAPQTAARLAALKSSRGGPDTREDNCLLPQTLPELVALYRQYPDARLVAGGTDLALDMARQHLPAPRLIALHQVGELAGVTLRGREVCIGATTPISDIQYALRPHLPAVAQILDRFASEQIRHQATPGGSLANASPVGDIAPILMALGATLELHSYRGSRQIPVSDFFTAWRRTVLQDGEFIAAIRFDLPAANQALLLRKITRRQDDDIATLFAAFWLHMEDARVVNARLAFGGMAATPVRARHTEQQLNGHLLTPLLIRQAIAGLAEDLQPIDDVRASGAYRLAVAGNLLRHFLRQAQSAGIPAPQEAL